MQGVGVLFLAFSGWLAYSALHSYRPIAMLGALITAPGKAKEILNSADASVSANAAAASSAGSVNPAAATTGAAPSTVAPLATAAPQPVRTIPAGYSNGGGTNA